ncbi:MAG: stalk domain-containing protein [Defluviitaleaceae bacterium]|nr:stalk domain-containing protein [Defluviitaleaceae bacterium]
MKKAMKCFTVLLLALLFAMAANPVSVHAIDIAAQAAIVMDFETGEILFQRDIHTPRVPASMTKAMTAFVVFEEIEAGNLSLDTLIPISTNAARISSDTNMQGAPFPLAVGSYHTVDMLLHLALLPSSNGACVALGEYISGTEAAFAVRMNESAAAIGMFSQFTNAHGAIAHYTNVYSIAVLVREFIYRYPDILHITGASYVNFGGVRRNNTNQLLTVRPYAGADGFRTGTTREAGWCLAATAYRDGRRIIAVVMNAPNNDRRYSDSITLLDFGFAEMERRDEARAQALRRSQIQIIHEGDAIAFNIPPRIVNNHAMAPAQELFKALGVYTLDIQPQIIDGVEFVPVRAVAYALNLQVVWDSETRTVTIAN